MNKKLVLALVFVGLAAAAAFADDQYRMGLIGSVEITDNPFDDASYAGMERFFPGFYCEMVFDHVGFGMTGLVRFSDNDPEIIAFTGGAEWSLTWIGSLDLRYHFFDTDCFIDPFVEVGIGCAGSVDMPYYDEIAHDYEEGRLRGLSLFGNAGGGVALNLECLQAGVKILYRFFNDRVPMTPFETVPVTPFETCLFVGVSF